MEVWVVGDDEVRYACTHVGCYATGVPAWQGAFKNCENCSLHPELCSWQIALLQETKKRNNFWASNMNWYEHCPLACEDDEGWAGPVLGAGQGSSATRMEVIVSIFAGGCTHSFWVGLHQIKDIKRTSERLSRSCTGFIWVQTDCERLSTAFKIFYFKREAFKKHCRKSLLNSDSILTVRCLTRVTFPNSHSKFQKVLGCSPLPPSPQSAKNHTKTTKHKNKNNTSLGDCLPPWLAPWLEAIAWRPSRAKEFTNPSTVFGFPPKNISNKHEFV